MRRVSRITRWTVAVLPMLVLQACGGTARPAAGPAVGSAAGSAISTAELEALYRARTDSALTRFTEADVRFMTGMILHHTQALVMSALAPTRGASPAVQTLTARTINAQEDEIATMRSWLEARSQPVPEIRISGTSLTVEGAPPGMGMMPGMLSVVQMRELGNSRGSDFDRLFLTYMIQHHGGAVTMVHELFATDGAALGDTVFKVASDIQVDQTTEIDRMERMLEALLPTGRSQ
jgi:uncharacterized protein (DUF305 family)